MPSGSPLPPPPFFFSFPLIPLTSLSSLSPFLPPRSNREAPGEKQRGVGGRTGAASATGGAAPGAEGTPEFFWFLGRKKFFYLSFFLFG